MSISTSTLRTKLWELGGNDPRYQSFLKAAGIEQYVSEKKSLYDKLLYLHRERMNQYAVFYQLFIGQHWATISDENINPLKVNYVWYNINKNAAFLMNKGFLVESDFPEVERFLQDNWKMNLGGDPTNNLFGLKLALQGGAFGDTWVTLLNGVHEQSGADYIKYSMMNPMHCFPVLSESNKLMGFLEYGEESRIYKMNDGFAEYEDITAGYFYTFGMRKRIVDEEVIRIDNFDFNEIPIIHFNNYPITHSYYGLSDASQIADLNMNIDSTLTDLDDIVKYHASPVTILKGAKGNELIKGANKVWSIPKDADVKNLQLAGDIISATNFLDRLRNGLAEISNTPAPKLDHISNTSAAALAIQFMPLYETMEMKRMFYGTAMLKMNAMTLKYAFLQGKLKPSEIIKSAIKRWEQDFTGADELTKQMNYPFSQKIVKPEQYDDLAMIYNNKLPKELYETYITWFPPLPRDEKNTADMVLAMVNGNLYSRRHGRSLMNMSEKESRLMEKEIKQELDLAREMAEFKTPMVVTNSSKVGKTGMEGDPTVKGDKESRRVEKEGKTKK